MVYRSNKKIVEQELENKLKKLVSLTLIILVVSIFSIIFLAPKISSIFGLLSKDRGKDHDNISYKPTTPFFSNLPEATKEKIIKLEGYGQEGSTIKLYVNGPEKATTLVGSDGKFVFDNVSLISGKNTIFAKAVDIKGLESDKTDVFTLLVDNQAPDIDIKSPKNGETVRNLDKRVEIEGVIDEKAQITIDDKLVIQKPDLSFTFLLGVEEGDRQVTIKAIDTAGNETEQKLFFKYVKQGD